MVSNSIFARVVKNLHPELSRDVKNLISPTLTDTSLMALIFKRFSSNYTPLNNFRDRMLFIAIIYRLYSPSNLFISRSAYNISQILIELLGYESESTAYKHFSQARAYYKNPVFREEVEILAGRLV